MRHILTVNFPAVGTKYSPPKTRARERLRRDTRCQSLTLYIASRMLASVRFFSKRLFASGTVRQYDHTGRFCVQLDYLNGERAYTLWL
jgi:hypothetical protein